MSMNSIGDEEIGPNNENGQFFATLIIKLFSLKVVTRRVLRPNHGHRKNLNKTVNLKGMKT
jgi:hypothetical protein